MSDLVLQVENVSKRFRIGAREPYYRLSESLTALGRSAWSLPRKLWRSATTRQTPAESPADFWALKDVSFEVREGEVVGIIGRNGAGKSTLLKILSRITEPTAGRVRVRGRVGSLLEVGTGFHPELTGRENIYLNGAILGMSRADVRRRFDEIVAFAEVERFLDTPVKRYSSGMYVRLGFAVAAHLEPEVLVIDEVLAVGDAEFQKKCLGKLSDAAKSGRTVLFVSHNTSSLHAFCTRGILLQSGGVLMDGPISSVLAKYQTECDVNRLEWHGPSGDELLQLLQAWVKPCAADDQWDTGVALEIGAVLNVLQPVDRVIFGFRLLSSYGTELAYTLFDDHEVGPTSTLSPQRLTRVWRIPEQTLASGRYHIAFEVGIAYQQVSHRLPMGELSFELHNLTGMGRRYPVQDVRGFDSILRPKWIQDDPLHESSER